MLGLLVLACSGTDAKERGVPTHADPTTTPTTGTTTTETTTKEWVEVANLTKEECDYDTGDNRCNGVRQGLRVSDEGGGTVHVLDVGVYLSCGGLSVSAWFEGTDLIQTRYDVEDSASCSCSHHVEFDLLGVPAGTWQIQRGSDAETVEVAAR